MDLLGRINKAYPEFEITDDRVEAWEDFMKNISYKSAAKRLEHHIAVYSNPPTIAEIRGTCTDEEYYH